MYRPVFPKLFYMKSNADNCILSCFPCYPEINANCIFFKLVGSLFMYLKKMSKVSVTLG